MKPLAKLPSALKVTPLLVKVAFAAVELPTNHKAPPAALATVGPFIVNVAFAAVALSENVEISDCAPPAVPPLQRKLPWSAEELPLK